MKKVIMDFSEGRNIAAAIANDLGANVNAAQDVYSVNTTPDGLIDGQPHIVSNHYVAANITNGRVHIEVFMENDGGGFTVIGVDPGFGSRIQTTHYFLPGAVQTDYISAAVLRLVDRQTWLTRQMRCREQALREAGMERLTGVGEVS